MGQHLSEAAYRASHEMYCDGDLGGCGRGEIGDPYTYVPSVWRFLVNEMGVSSVLDVGCGFGYSLKWFQDAGCDAWGIEGSADVAGQAVAPCVICHDFTTGPCTFPFGAFDLAWCSEFLEHVESVYEPNIFAALRLARLVVCTAAAPGQPGHHHVNCRPLSYWVGRFAGHGFTLNKSLGSYLRWLAAADHPGSYFSRIGMVFTRRDGEAPSAKADGFSGHACLSPTTLRPAGPFRASQPCG